MAESSSVEQGRNAFVKSECNGPFPFQKSVRLHTQKSWKDPQQLSTVVIFYLCVGGSGGSRGLLSKGKVDSLHFSKFSFFKQ